MTSINTSRSLVEQSSWKGVGDLFQERLVGGIASSQGKEAYDVVVQIDLCPHQAVQPMPIDKQWVSQQADAACIVRASQKDNLAAKGLFEVHPPPFGKAATWRCGIDASGHALPGGGDELCGTAGQTADRVMFETCPDLGLPASVETLDGSLKTGLVGRSKDGNHSQTQAQSRHTSNRIGLLSGTLKTVVVVELSVGGEARRPPAFQQGLKDTF